MGRRSYCLDVHHACRKLRRGRIGAGKFNWNTKPRDANVTPTAQATDSNYVLTLEEIGTLAKEGGKPAETLMNVVALIAKRFETDVCSAYLLEPDRANLVLAATIGLRPECIGKLRLGLHEGLGRSGGGGSAARCGRAGEESSALQIFPRSGRGRLAIVSRRSADRSWGSARSIDCADVCSRGFSWTAKCARWPRPPRK